MNFLNVLVTKVDSSKKYRASLDDIKNVCTILVQCFDAFNNLDEDSVMFNPWNRSLNDIPVPDELTFYIQPASVRWNPLDRKTKDVLFRSNIQISEESDDFSSALKYSYSDYINAIIKFRGFFKKEGLNDCATLQSLRRAMSLSDVISKSCGSAGAHYYSDVAYWPIPLKDCVFSLFEESFLNVETDVVKEDFIANLRF